LFVLNNPVDNHPSAQLSRDALVDMYTLMVRSRRLDERAWALHRQGRIVFHVSAMGHEAAQVGAAFAIQRGIDYVHPYYRDLTLMLALGYTPREHLASLMGRASDPSSAGRQMPYHFSLRDRNVISGSAVVATQVPEAAGLAFAIQYKQRLGLVDPADPTHPRLALTCLGEGSTSQGEWHEGMNWAGVHRLPFICLVQNNTYAISVPVQRQMAVPSVADRAAAYGVAGVSVDGLDPLAVYDAMHAAVQRAYAGEGATLIEARVYRLTPHSSDDDDRSYRSRDEVEAWKARDPIVTFGARLIADGVLNEAQAAEIDARARAEVDEAQASVEAEPLPPGEAALFPVYAPLED
jgi:2-oxoisovalerate dehydrogenase E1 component alpha subunit